MTTARVWCGAVALVVLAACGGEADPTAAVAAAARPAAAPPPGAAAAGPAELPPPSLWPRKQWKRLRVGSARNVASAYSAAALQPQPDGTRRSWVVVNLRDSIPMPETGGRARSAAYLAEFDCAKHAWQPIESVWFAQPDAKQEILRERPRGPQEVRRVAEGSAIDPFLDAVCKL